ncbi:MAG: DnaJ domain-containing protein [Armatimonadetes bacterium]|nr:DnaJ domain-containing protein [Armatimonadota bacterium]
MTLEPVASLYEILGVDPKAKSQTLRNAYRRLARKYHPDINPDPVAHERMAQINMAFETLNDPSRRMEYDATLFGTPGITAAAVKAAEQTRDSVSVRLVQKLKDHRTPIYSLAFEPDTNQLLSSSFDNQILWWGKDFQVRRSLRLEGGVVNVVHPIGDDKIVAAGCSESLVSVWQINSGEVISWRNSPLEWICCVGIAPDGSKVALGSIHSVVQVCRTPTGDVVFSGNNHDQSVTAVQWSPDGKLLATGSADATVKIWSAVTGKLLHTFTAVRSTVTAMAFSPDSRILAVAAVDRSIRIFRLGDNDLIKTFFGHEKPIESVAFHPDGQLMASVGRDGVVYLWNVLQGRGHGKIEASDQPLSTAAFSHTGNLFAVGGLDKVIRIYELNFK